MSATLAVVIPYYNEARWIGRTLRCLLGQTEPPQELILVDNGSTDGSERLCREVLAASPWLAVRYEREARPGKIHALERACGLLTTRLAAFWDADTWYPAHYLHRARELDAAAGQGVAAFMAIDVHGSPRELRWRLRRRLHPPLARVLRRQCFTGGYGHVYRTEALLRAGGYSAARWPYVLMDHEVVHRIHAIGETVYDADFWCRPSARRTDRRRVRWNAVERFLYLAVPVARRDWYFYRFLAGRLARRGLGHLRLREQPWNGPAA